MTADQLHHERLVTLAWAIALALALVTAGARVESVSASNPPVSLLDQPAEMAAAADDDVPRVRRGVLVTPR